MVNESDIGAVYRLDEFYGLLDEEEMKLLDRLQTIWDNLGNELNDDGQAAIKNSMRKFVKDYFKGKDDGPTQEEAS